MTEQNIEQLARHRKVPSWVLKLVADAISHEREACAKLCEAEAEKQYDNWDIPLTTVAAAIRARGNI